MAGNIHQVGLTVRAADRLRRNRHPAGLAFAVPTRAELSDWERRFAAAGVISTPAAPANPIPGAAVVVFRDPGNIQLELLFEPRQCPPASGTEPGARNATVLYA
jgi:Glyoxalase/Bleomycin resistance protein/Dioxygenase superfamily